MRDGTWRVAAHITVPPTTAVESPPAARRSSSSRGSSRRGRSRTSISVGADDRDERARMSRGAGGDTSLHTLDYTQGYGAGTAESVPGGRAKQVTTQRAHEDVLSWVGARRWAVGRWGGRAGAGTASRWSPPSRPTPGERSELRKSCSEPLGKVPPGRNRAGSSRATTGGAGTPGTGGAAAGRSSRA